MAMRKRSEVVRDTGGLQSSASVVSAEPIRLAMEVGPNPSQTIYETSRQLVEELKKADVIRPVTQGLFRTANGRGAKPGEVVPSEFDGLVETVFSVPDLRQEHAELVASLRIGDNRTDYGTVVRALDEAEDNARRAHRLYLAARLEQERWTIDADKTEAGMRAAAVSALEQEKAHNDRTKRIVEADVDAKVVDMHPDAYERLKIKRVKVKGTVEAMERLAELCKARCFSLAAILQTMRRP